MSFGALAAWQALLLLAAAGGLAAWLFRLKLRPPRINVPSLLLWRRVLDASRELTLWERIRWVVSLILTVVIALALALALARPSPASGTAVVSRGRQLVVIDSSWSMLARTRNGETRWERAVAEARRLAAAGSDDEMALATTADGVVQGPTTDLALLDAALDRLSPTGGEGTSWPRLAGADVAHFITDGSLARPLDPGVIVHSVFEPAANVAITAFDVRGSLAGGHAGDAYLEVANFAASAQKVHVTLVRGTATIVDRQVDMGAGESFRDVVSLGQGAEASLSAHVDASQNALTIDDDAVAWIERAGPLAVTVVGQQTRWLGALLGRDPDVRATFIDPSAYPSSSGQKDRPGQEDVFIFDRWAPKEPPARPSLSFAPPLDTPWLSNTDSGSVPESATEEKRPRWDVAGSHPVVRGVDPLTLTIEKARAYRAPALMPVAQSARGTPLVYISESSGRRIVVVTFGPGESNLASAPGFPVLVGNALEWLAKPAVLSKGSGQTAGVRPGTVSFDDAVISVTGPRDVPVPLIKIKGPAEAGHYRQGEGPAEPGHYRQGEGPAEPGHRKIAVLRAPGLYVAEGSGSRGTIAVNVGSPQISNLARTSLSATDQARQVTAGASGQPWWLYCAVAAFALALAEWWTWQRRITV